MSKRILTILAGLLVLSMILTACGPKAAECTDPLGCVSVAKGDPIHIAYAMVIAGPDTTQFAAVDGVKLLVAQNAPIEGV